MSAPPRPRVAVVHPEPGVGRELASVLSRDGYELALYPSLGRFFDALLRKRPDLAVLGMQLPGMDGHELLRTLRRNPETNRLLLVGLSNRPRTKDEAVSAFSAGADEYFFRPWERDLLTVRVRSLIGRRNQPPPEEVLRCPGVVVHPDSRSCEVARKRVRLTRLEFDLLVLLLRNPARVLTRGHLIDRLWRTDGARGERAVDRHMHALRTKLGASGGLIETVIGVGYVLSGSVK